MVKVLHCLPSFDNKMGGLVHAALNVCKYLILSHEDAEVLAPYTEGDDINYLSIDYKELNCRRVPRSFPSRFSNSREMGNWLRKNVKKYQIVEIHGIWVLTSFIAARICINCKIPYFVRPHGSLDPFDLQKRSLLKRLLGPIYVHWLLKYSAGVICTADKEAERLVTYGANPMKHVIPLPVPLWECPGHGSKLRDSLGIPKDAQVVLFLSRIDYKKGIEFLITAIGRLKGEFPKLWLIIAGSGTKEYTDRVHGWLEKLQVRSFTSLVGFVTGQSKADVFAAADIFALPSLNENFGIVNVEAMQAALPLLISDEVYICKEIEKAGAGIICEPTNDSVTKCLRMMLDGSVDLKIMGNRGKLLVQKRYKPAAATQMLVSLYNATMIEKHRYE